MFWKVIDQFLHHFFYIFVFLRDEHSIKHIFQSKIRRLIILVPRKREYKFIHWGIVSYQRCLRWFDKRFISPRLSNVKLGSSTQLREYLHSGIGNLW